MSVIFDYDSVRLFAVEHGDFLRWSFFFLLLAIVVIVAGAVILYHKLRKAGFRKASVALLGIGVCVAVGAVKPGTNGVNRASVRGVRTVDSLETSGDGESAPQGFRPTRFAVATNRLEVSVAWDEDDEIGLIAYRTAHSLSPPVWSPYSCVTEFLDPTGHLWTVDAPSTNSSFFVDVSGHSLDGDADEDGVSNGRELSLGTDPFSAHSDADWLTDGQELGVASVCRPSGFLWFEISSEGRNELWQSADDWDTWVELDGGLRIGRTNYRCAVMSLDGFCNLLPDFNWRQDQVVSWSGTNRLETTDFSRGAISVLPFGADLWGTSGVSGMYVESVCSNDVTYDVLEWKNVGPDNGNRGTNGNASFEVIIPSDETNTLYVSYLGLGGSAASADPVCGVQDSSRRSAVDPTSFYAIPSPRAPKAGMTVKYVFGENTDPTVDDPEWMYVGQGDDWVRANFARLRQVVPSLVDVEEILSVGYTNWVDACVGRGLTNGLYKLEVVLGSMPDTQNAITVGDYHVVMTNSGSCVFLLEKLKDYRLSALDPQNLEWLASDDTDNAPERRSLSTNGGCNQWSVDGGLSLIFPDLRGDGLCRWLPYFTASPSVGHWHPSERCKCFSAVFVDLCGSSVPEYRWACASGDIIISSPHSQTTEMSLVGTPSWGETTLYVTARVGDVVFTSSVQVEYGENDSPQVYFNVNVPTVVFKSEQGPTFDLLQPFSFSVSSDAPLDGTIALNFRNTGGAVALWSDGLRSHRLGGVQIWSADEFQTFSGYIEGVSTSSQLGDVVVSASYFDRDGQRIEKNLSVTVVDVGNIQIPSAPATGLVVLKGMPISMNVELVPTGASALLRSQWYVRRLRRDGSYTDWSLVGMNERGTDFIYEPGEGGIYHVMSYVSNSQQEQALVARSYIWDESEPMGVGLMERGSRKAFGVVDETWQMDLRNAALGYMGSTEYLLKVEMPAKYGYSSSPSGEPHYKCNLFVAHMTAIANIKVPAIHGSWTHSYPPIAQEWKDPTMSFGDWVPVDELGLPQPGYVAATEGHVGILDFDGKGISAGSANVNRRMHACERTANIGMKRFNGRVDHENQ